MRLSLAHSFLFLATSSTLIGVNGQVPPNDLCSDAIVISTADPTIVEGTYENATTDEYNQDDPDCSFVQVPSGSYGVWYRIEGFPDGTELRLECARVDCHLMTTNDGCDGTFLCVPGSTVGRGPNGVLRYRWTTAVDGFSAYYVFVGDELDTAMQKDFTLTVSEATAEPTMTPTSTKSLPPSSVDDSSGTFMVSMTASVLASCVVAAAFFA